MISMRLSSRAMSTRCATLSTLASGSAPIGGYTSSRPPPPAPSSPKSLSPVETASEGSDQAARQGPPPRSPRRRGEGGGAGRLDRAPRLRSFFDPGKSDALNGMPGFLPALVLALLPLLLLLVIVQVRLACNRSKKHSKAIRTAHRNRVTRPPPRPRSVDPIRQFAGVAHRGLLPASCSGARTRHKYNRMRASCSGARTQHKYNRMRFKPLPPSEDNRNQPKILIPLRFPAPVCARKACTLDETHRGRSAGLQ